MAKKPKQKQLWKTPAKKPKPIDNEKMKLFARVRPVMKKNAPRTTK